jgi:hypothetical protein
MRQAGERRCGRLGVKEKDYGKRIGNSSYRTIRIDRISNHHITRGIQAKTQHSIPDGCAHPMFMMGDDQTKSQDARGTDQGREDHTRKTVLGLGGPAFMRG